MGENRWHRTDMDVKSHMNLLYGWTLWRLAAHSLDLFGSTFYGWLLRYGIINLLTGCVIYTPLLPVFEKTCVLNLGFATCILLLSKWYHILPLHPPTYFVLFLFLLVLFNFRTSSSLCSFVYFPIAFHRSVANLKLHRFLRLRSIKDKALERKVMIIAPTGNTKIL